MARLGFLDGGGRMGALMREHDWSRSPLGDPASWPDALKTAVATCLSSRFPMVIWWGPELVMLYNDAWQPILGDTKHPAGLGRPGAESWPETWPIVGVEFESALKGEASWSEDLLLASDRHGYLQECYFTYSHSPLRDAFGAVVGVHSVVSETTARVLNERRLRALRDLSNAAVEATSEAGSVGAVSRTLVDLLCADNPDVPFAVQYLIDGGGRARLLTCAGIDASPFPPEVAPADDDPWGIARVMRTRAHAVIDHTPSMSAPLPGGAWPEPTVQLVALPLGRSTADAELGGVLLVGINSRLRLDPPYLDFLRLAAAQLASAVSALQLVDDERMARAEAERAARVKDEFLATLSHELRTPLNAVLGWTEILKLDLADTARASAAVEVIERNARLQARLITDLLDVSRIVSGNLTLSLEAVDLVAVVEAAVESVLPDASGKGVVVRTTFDPVRAVVEADPARMQQVVWNLLVNAIKFTPGGGAVDVDVKAFDDRAEIRVIDTGEGIEPEFLPRIFDRFRQADATPSRRHGGLGLGLAIVKQLTELHGGRVRAASDGRGRGATFAIEIPLAAGSDRIAESAAHAAGVAADRLDGVRLLVVEDEPDALDMARRLLEDRGAAVRTARAVDAALALLASEPFDVIVSDIGMPDRDGYEFITEVRRRGDPTPAVAVTALAHADDRVTALAAGFQAHVPKPVENADLLAIVARLVRRG